MTPTKTAPVPAPAPAVVPTPVGPPSDWTKAQLVHAFPKAPARAIGEYTPTELAAMKNLGPGMLGGELYWAVQQSSTLSGGGILGPAITSKSSTPVKSVTEA